jgi:hypothetical protein
VNEWLPALSGVVSLLWAVYTWWGMTRADALQRHYDAVLHAGDRDARGGVLAIEPRVSWVNPALAPAGHFERRYRSGKDRHGTGNGTAALLKDYAWVPDRAPRDAVAPRYLLHPAASGDFRH